MLAPDTDRGYDRCMTTGRMADGRYTFSNLERPCTCGHPLSVHTGERVRNRKTGAVEQPCMCDDGCDCDCFAPEGSRAR